MLVLVRDWRGHDMLKQTALRGQASISNFNLIG
jgi:hypothetical protein